MGMTWMAADCVLKSLAADAIKVSVWVLAGEVEWEWEWAWAWAVAASVGCLVVRDQNHIFSSAYSV